MALFTGKGDDGKTSLIGKQTAVFGCNQKISKSSAVAEALGSLDEINSFLGLCKVQSVYLDFKLNDISLAEIVHQMQKNLFIVQAELAGADKTIKEDKVKELEELISDIEKQLPPIKSFFVSGGPADITKWQQSGAGLGAIFDIARTIARRAERRVVAVSEEVLQPSLLTQNSQTDPVPAPSPQPDKDIVSEHTKSYLNRLSSALYALARYANHKVGIMEEAPDYR